MRRAHTRRWLWCLLALVAVSVGLRLVGVKEERRVLWDERRPDVEVFFQQPWRYVKHEIGQAWGRPGLNLMKTAGLVFTKLVQRPLRTGFPWLPLPFNFLLEMVTVLMLVDIVRRSCPGDTPATTGRALLAGVAWATSPLAIWYSHRLLPPVYVMPLMLGALWLFLIGIGRRESLSMIGAGVLTGASFVTYPGTYHVLMCSPALLLSPEVRRGLTWRRAVLFGSAAAAVPLCMQALTLGIRHFDDPGFFTYARQLWLLSQTVTLGEPSENAGFPFAFAWAVKEYWVWPLLALAGAGLLTRRRAALPWLAIVAGVYGLWVLNGPVLGREVVYGRTVILLYPILIIAATVALPGRLAASLGKPRWFMAVLCVASLVVFVILTRQPRHRVSGQEVVEMASEVLGVCETDIVIVDRHNDYGSTTATTLSAVREELAKLPPGKHAVVAFNLRAVSHPLLPCAELGVVPLAVWPSPIREPYAQFEGHSAAERAIIRKHPEWFDIKLYDGRTLFANESTENGMGR